MKSIARTVLFGAVLFVGCVLTGCSDEDNALRACDSQPNPDACRQQVYKDAETKIEKPIQ